MKKKNQIKTAPKSEIKNKVITNYYLGVIITVLVIFGAVMMISSGMFDSAEAKVSLPQNENTDHNHSGANLNNLTRIDELDKALASNPKNHEILLELAHLLNDSGMYDKAIVKYNAYLSTHPQNADVIVDMGVCYYAKGDYSNAVKTMENALKVNPNHQIGNFNLGIVNMAMQNIDKAKEWWGKAVKLNPNSDIGIKAKELINSHN